VSLNGVRFAPCNCLTNDEDEDVLFMFVTGNEDNEYTSASKYAVILDTDAAEEKNGDDTVYTYDVVIEGEETTLTFENELDAKYNDGDVIAYKMGTKYAEIDDNATVFVQEATAANKDYVTFNGKQYNLGDETTYTITLEYKNVNLAKDEVFNPDDYTVDTVTVSEGGKIGKGDKVAYTLDKGDLDVVFVYEYNY